MENENKGAQVKTGDDFGLIGWWINKDLNDPLNPLFVEAPEDKVPGASKRLIFVYFGKNKPTTDEMRALIESIDFIYPDAEY